MFSMKNRYLTVFFGVVVGSMMIVACANAENAPHMSVDDQDAHIQYDMSVGSVHHTEIRIVNDADQAWKGQLVTKKNEQQDQHVNTMTPLSVMRFYVMSDLSDVHAEALRSNKFDVATLCKKERESLGEWCDGQEMVDVALSAGEEVFIVGELHLADQAVDHELYVALQNDNAVDGDRDVVQQIHIQYHVPDKNIAQLQLRKFVLEREFPITDINAWFRSGLRDDYSAYISHVNTGTESIQYAYFTEVQSQWIGEKISFSASGSSMPKEEHQEKLHVTMPRFGKVVIIGGVSYVDQDQKNVELRSDPIEMMIWPVHLIGTIFVFSCFCVICVLLYKYVKKHMFGFRKNKKDEKQFAGTYVVQDTDNIISIAQMFGVPWKELAAHNKIDPPYILISGETIMVPSTQKKIVENDHNGAKEQLSVESEPIVRESVLRYEPTPTPAQAEAVKPHSSTILPIETSDDAVYHKPPREITEGASPIYSQREKTDHLSGAHESIKRKVNYAAPQSMLAQPASEPTTRAIDIEWMRDDEEAYNEEMEFQRKRVNKNLTIFVVAGIFVFGAVIVWGVMQWMNRDAKEKISVDTLISEDITQATEDRSGQEEMLEQNEQEKIEVKTTEVDMENGNAQENASEQNGQNTQKEPGQITIQVLNAGAKTGAAGAVSKSFADKGYKVNTAQNAQNSYTGVNIYYTSDIKDQMDAIAQIVKEEYGTQKKEESDDVLKKYNADVVIVLGT